MFRLRSLLLSIMSLSLAACSNVAFLAVNVPALFGNYHRSADVAYGDLPLQRLDVYQPTLKQSAGGSETARPIVIFVHGGSWSGGDKNQYRFVGATLAEQGWIGVVVDYRLYPAVKFPTFVDDVALAVQYVRAHAAEWGGDAQQIYLMGHSAGAHIAMTAALDPEFLRTRGGDSHWLRGVIGLAGAYDFMPFDFAYMFDLFGPESAYPRSQPVNFARADAPPLLLLHGKSDKTVQLRNTINLTAAMQRVGGRVETKYYEGVGHIDIVAVLSIPARGRAPVLADIAAFINETSTSRAIGHMSLPTELAH